MSILIIDKAKCQRLYEYARTHPQEVMKLPIEPIGDNENHRIYLGDFRVVFSFEKQPSGFFRHLSVSLHPPKKDKAPSFHVVQALMEVFKFEELDRAKMIGKAWVENHEAINVLELVTVVRDWQETPRLFS